MSKDTNNFNSMNHYSESPKTINRIGVGILGYNLLSEEEIKDLLGEDEDQLLNLEK